MTMFKTKCVNEVMDMDTKLICCRHFRINDDQFKGYVLLKIPSVPMRVLSIQLFQIRDWENAI